MHDIIRIIWYKCTRFTNKKRHLNSECLCLFNLSRYEMEDSRSEADKKSQKNNEKKSKLVFLVKNLVIITRKIIDAKNVVLFLWTWECICALILCKTLHAFHTCAVVISISKTANVQILTISKTSVTALPVVDKCLDCNYAMCMLHYVERVTTCKRVFVYSLFFSLLSRLLYMCICMCVYMFWLLSMPLHNICAWVLFFCFNLELLSFSLQFVSSALFQ